MVSSFVVHTIAGSPAARAVMAALIEKGASFRVAGLTPGAHKMEPHLSRHPFGKMPVLEHGDFSLYETQAILRYLERILPSPPLIPEEPKDAARMNQVMGISDWYLFQGVNNVIGFHRIVGPRLMGLTPDDFSGHASGTRRIRGAVSSAWREGLSCISGGDSCRPNGGAAHGLSCANTGMERINAGPVQSRGMAWADE